MILHIIYSSYLQVGELQEIQKGLEVQLKEKAADVAEIIKDLEVEKASVNDMKQVSLLK